MDQTAQAFDDNTLLLITAASQADLNQDTKTWHSNNDRYSRLLDKYRGNDDEILTLIRDNISLDALEVIRSSNPLHTSSFPSFTIHLHQQIGNLHKNFHFPIFSQ